MGERTVEVPEMREGRGEGGRAGVLERLALVHEDDLGAVFLARYPTAAAAAAAAATAPPASSSKPAFTRSNSSGSKGPSSFFLKTSLTPAVKKDEVNPSPSSVPSYTYCLLRASNKASLVASHAEAAALKRAALSSLLSSRLAPRGGASPFLPPLIASFSSSNTHPHTFLQLLAGQPVASFRRLLQEGWGEGGVEGGREGRFLHSSSPSFFSWGGGGNPSSSATPSPSSSPAKPNQPHQLPQDHATGVLPPSFPSSLQASTLPTRERVFDERSVKYVAAALLSLLGDLHESQLLFRGLQPELLYVDALGRLLATDFRHAKVGLEKTYTLCGHAAYAAPEMVSRRGHQQAVDYWQLGILLFELLTGGDTPFALAAAATHAAQNEKGATAGGGGGGVEARGEDEKAPLPTEDEIYRSISSYTSSSFLPWPSTLPLSPDCKSFISSLLAPNPSSRLGSRQGTVEGKTHRWLKGMKFDELFCASFGGGGGGREGRREMLSPLYPVTQAWLRKKLVGVDGEGGWEEVAEAWRRVNEGRYEGKQELYEFGF